MKSEGIEMKDDSGEKRKTFTHGSSGGSSNGKGDVPKAVIKDVVTLTPSGARARAHVEGPSTTPRT